jgi:hypothetical protein
VKLALLLAVVIVARAGVAAESDLATVYVLPVPKDAAELAAKLGNAPMPIPPDAVFTLVIDDTHTVEVDTSRGAVVEQLATDRDHDVRVSLGGKPYARFRFTFAKGWSFGSGPKRLAIYMDAMYSTWRVWRCDRVRRCDDVRAGSRPRAAAAPATGAMIDADTCPHPEPGLFHLRAALASETAARDLLFARYDGNPLLFVVVQPSFDPSYLVAVDRPSRKHDAPYKLRVIRARHDEAKGALATTENAHEIDRTLAEKLLAVWTGVLQRTQHVRPQPRTRDGRLVFVAREDGTTYNLFAEGMSARTRSPTTGSLLADFVAIVGRLTHLPDTLQPGDAVKQVSERADRLLARLARNEPCLKPYEPRDGPP